MIVYPIKWSRLIAAVDLYSLTGQLIEDGHVLSRIEPPFAVLFFDHDQRVPNIGPSDWHSLEANSRSYA